MAMTDAIPVQAASTWRAPFLDQRLAPTSAVERISAIDMLRGVAVLGILILNIVAFALPHQAYDDPTVAGGASDVDRAMWVVSTIAFEGKMRAVFSLLFGAGVILLTSRMEARGAGQQVADIYYRRNLWLVGFGIVHAYLLLWWGEILYMYGVTALFLFPFRRLSPRALVLLGAIVLSILLPKEWLAYHQLQTLRLKADAAQAVKAANHRLTDDQQADIRAWTDRLDEAKPNAKALHKEITERRSGYFSNVASLSPVNVDGQSTGFYLWAFWDCAGMMLIGMGLVKNGFLNGIATSRTYLLGALAGYGLGLPLTVLRVYSWMTSGFAPFGWFPSPLPGTYEFARLGMALGHVSVLLLLYRSGRMRWIVERLAAVGQMALTNYIMQTVICVIVFYGVGLGLFGHLQRHQLYYVLAAIWVAELAWSAPWLRRFRFGPCEWLWRSLTYAHRQPFRRERSVVTPHTAVAI
jgi:uncharacterized protein